MLRGMMQRRTRVAMGRPVSFPEGLGELPAALAAALGQRRTVARAEAIAPVTQGTTRAAGSLARRRRHRGSGAARPRHPGRRHRAAAGAARPRGGRCPPDDSARPGRGRLPRLQERRQPRRQSRRLRVRRGPRRADPIARLPVRIVGLPRQGPRRRRADPHPDLAAPSPPRSSTGPRRSSPARRCSTCAAPRGLRRDPDFVDVWRARPGIPQYDCGTPRASPPSTPPS